jgi:diguanylate cyclase (GGDEF)-like protein
LSDKEFSLYAEEEKIISRANEFIGLEEINNVQQLQTEYKSLLDNYKKLFKQSKRLIRMSDKMEAELAITKAELEKYSKKLQMQATTDTLTGLANRRKITELLKEEIKKLEEDNNNNFNIIMLDIDFFKKVNDNYGHPMGDEVIKKVSNHMQDKVGSEGVVGRFGGEEFLTILYNNNIQEAALLANQIRSDIESKKIEFEGKQISVTVSMGIACSAETGIYQELLNKADERLYKAKESGRNQVITS